MKIMEAQKVTIYSSSEFFGSFNKYEGKLIDHGTEKYAQYNNAPFVKWIPSRKRNPVQLLKANKPMILVLEGIGHPAPDSLYNEPHYSNETVQVSKSRYSAFDEGWSNDFDLMIDKYIAENNVKIIADYRHTKGFDSYGNNA